MNIHNFLKNRKTVLRPAKVTLSNVLAVVQAWFRKQRRNMGGLDLPDHLYEQIIWRRVEVMRYSPKCWYKGSCQVCGCDILGKTMEDRGCSVSEHPDLLEQRKPCYPEMMNKENWESFKRIHKIKLFE